MKIGIDGTAFAPRVSEGNGGVTREGWSGLTISPGGGTGTITLIDTASSTETLI